MTPVLQRLLRPAAMAALLLGSCTAQANLVANASFESPNIVGGAYQLFTTGSTAITGWTVLGGAGESIQLTPDTYLGLKASDGRQWIDLTGIYGYDKGLRSDSFATTVGQHYTVGFDVGNYLPFGRSTVGLAINGATEQLFTNTSLVGGGTYPMDWQHFSTDFVATSTTTQLSFFGRANGALSNNAGIGLDNVSVSLAASVSAVPEPEIDTLMLAGLGALGLLGRRCRQAPAGAEVG